VFCPSKSLTPTLPSFWSLFKHPLSIESFPIHLFKVSIPPPPWLLPPLFSFSF
jgi:hypothetical protein